VNLVDRSIEQLQLDMIEGRFTARSLIEAHNRLVSPFRAGRREAAP